jgi:hypothetical protein
MQKELPLNSFQRRLLAVPEELDVFVGGGRGGGKSYGLALISLRHAEQYGRHARILYLRRSYRGLADFELLTRDLFATIYGMGARYNAAEHVWKLPGGGYLELGQLETPGDYSKYQGRSFTLLMVDEAGQYAEPLLLDHLRSNLRGPKDVPTRMLVAANPGGVGHHWLACRYVFRAAPWTIFHEEASGRQWVYAPSTFRENDFIDREQYLAQLEAACPDDAELLRAWTDGDWAVNRGAYFAAVLEESRVALDPWEWIPDGWATYLAHDFGSSAPSVTYVVAVSPGEELGGRYFPRNSLLLVDELAAVKRGQLNSGLGWTTQQISEAIRAMCSKWRIAPAGVADDSIFAATGHQTGSLADEFRTHGVYFSRAKKGGRVAGWQVMRRLLANAGKADRAGLYVSRACEYFWATVPYLARDDRRIEDVDSDGPDHAADAARYACMALRPAREVDLGIAC